MVHSSTNLSVNSGIATGGGFSANSIASAASLMDAYLQEEVCGYAQLEPTTLHSRGVELQMMLSPSNLE